MNKTIFAVSLIIIFSAIFSICIPRTVSTFESDIDILIDAGHGYPDGGAVSKDGTTEADLNLAIALMLNDTLNEKGIKSHLIRDTSESIYTEGNSIHSKKISDVRNRVKIAKNNSHAIVVSIHMNTFPSADVYGAQVFYKKSSDKSQSIALELQNAINTKFQSENKKQIKKIPENIYFFNHIPNECVLIECGFMTNEAELEKLKDTAYQKKISDTISEVLIYKLLGE